MYSEEIMISTKFNKSLPEGRRMHTLKKLKYFFTIYAESKNRAIHTGARPMEIRGVPGVYKLRTSRGERVLYEITEDNNIILREYSSHDDQITRAKNMGKNESSNISFDSVLKKSEKENEYDQYEIEITDYTPLNIEQTEIIIATDEWLSECEDTQDYIWLASKEQAEIIKSNQYPLFISGSAGTGKTTVLFQKLCGLAQSQSDILYITISKALKEDFQRIYNKFKPKKETAQITFLTIDELYGNLMPDHRKIAAQEQFLLEFNDICRRCKINPQDTWCEIEGIIKSHLGITKENTISFLDQLLSSDSTTLSYENYRNVKSKYSYFSIESRNTVYDIVKKYDKWLTEQNLMDVNQVAADIIKSGVEKKYDLIIIDEVQDFTELQLYMLMKLAKTVTRIIFCGDINQNVHPTFFMFERLYNIYYSLGNKNAKDNMHTLTKNYRSCKEIVVLLNRILEEQGLRIGFQGSKEDEGINETGFRSGYSPVYLESTDENLNAILNAIYDKHYAIAVTPDEQMQKILTDSCPEAKGRIFTVQEAKGLEYEVVFTINVTTMYEKEWRKIINGNEVKRIRRYRRFFGYIYVAASRARNHLVIVEEKNCSFLNIINGTYDILETWDLEKVGLARQSTADEFDKDAKKLEKAGLSEKAEEARKMAKKLRERKESEREIVPEPTILSKKDESKELNKPDLVPLTKRLFLINDNNKQGIINDQGDVVVECKYDSITYSTYKDKSGRSVFECRINNKVTYYDRNGEVFNLMPRNNKRKAIIAASVAILLTITLAVVLLVVKPFKKDHSANTAKVEIKPPKPISKFIKGDIVQVSAGFIHSAALTEDGTVWVWGDNIFDGHTAKFEEIQGRYAISVTFRDENNKPTNKKVSLDNVSYVAAGNYITAALKKDGSLWTWGFNSYGALGNGIDFAVPGINFKVDSTPYKILDDVESVSIGDSWGLALKKDGTLWTWGLNIYGNLGNGTTDYSIVPVKIMEDVSAAAAGAGHGLALKKDGTIWGWGSNENGQLDIDVNSPNIIIRPQMIMEGVAQIFAGHMQSSVVLDDGTLWIWGNINSTKTHQRIRLKREDGVARVVAGNDMILVQSISGKLYRYLAQEDELVPILDSVAQVSMIKDHCLAVKKDGSVWAWGKNDKSKLGDGTFENRDTPVLVYQNKSED